MDDATLLRYSRHLLLNEIGIEGQERIGRARMLLVGAGGLGSAAALYLVAAGIGHLVLFDDDAVELSNLQRQILHTTERIGQPKADSAGQALRALNPLVTVQTRAERADAAALAALLPQTDVVLDCSDNRATRYAINRACVHAGVALVSGSASAFTGQLSVHDLRDADAACYACLFPEGPGEDDSCATTGVFAPLAGLIGAMQAGEALRLVSPFGQPARGRLLAIDAREMALHRIAYQRDPQCPVCRDRQVPLRT